MISAARYHGGSVYVGSAVDVTLDMLTYDVHVVNMSAASKSVTLQDARNPILGGVGHNLLWVLNIGANTFTVKDAGGSTVDTLMTNQACALSLAGAPDAAGRWSSRKGSIA